MELGILMPSLKGFSPGRKSKGLCLKNVNNKPWVKKGLSDFIFLFHSKFDKGPKKPTPFTEIEISEFLTQTCFFASI